MIRWTHFAARLLGLLSAIALAERAIALTEPTTLPTSRPADGEPNPPRRIAWVGEAPSFEPDIYAAPTGHLFVRPLVNGVDGGWWFLDTGAGINCIDRALADELKLPVLREGKATGMGGDAATNYRAVETLALGPALLEASEAIELDLSGFEQYMGRKVNGIIGYDTFFAAVFEIDHRAGRVTIHDPNRYALEEAEWLNIQLLDRRPSVTGSIEGHMPGQLMIDSGSNTGAVVTSPTVKALGLLEGRETTTRLQGGVGGMRRQKSGQLADVTIGHLHLKRVDAIFSEMDKGGSASEKYQAILGIPVLRQFILVVNYPQAKMAMKLNTDAATTKPAVP